MTSDNTFEELQKRFAELQERWDALTPEQQEAERVKYAAYDERILSEAGYFDDEPDEDDND